MTRASSRWAVALLAIIGMVLPGCAQIPRSGPVIAAGPVDSGEGTRGFQPVVAGPDPGDPPLAILSGFVRAMVSSADGYLGARAFLTGRATQTWEPRAKMVVFTGTPVFHVATNAEVPNSNDVDPALERVQGAVTVNQLAVVDAHGTYTPSAAGTKSTSTVNLVKNADGQWRIDGTQNVSLISADDFGFTFRGYPVYFLTADATHLVPVVKWFPNGPDVATRLVAEVLAGPPARLSAAVRSAVPPGTALAPPTSVTTQDNTAVVDLTGSVKSASPTERVQLRAQLLQTLQGVLNVVDVQIRVDGGAIDISAPASAPTPVPMPGGSAVVLARGRLVTFNGSDLAAVEGIVSFAGREASNPAVSADETRFAVLTQQRSQLRVLVAGQGMPGAAFTGADLTTPSFDSYGFVWTSPRRNDGTVPALAGNGSVVQVKAKWLAGRSVTSIRISPDGTQAAIASSGADGSTGRLDVAAVKRDANIPVELVRWPNSPLPRVTGSVQQVCWVSQTDLVVLEAGSSGYGVVRRVALDGPAQPTLGSVPGARTLAAGGLGVRNLLVGTRGGRIYQQAGALWLPVPGLDPSFDPAYPG